MRTDEAPLIRLEDYRPPDFLVDRVELDIALHPADTRVAATLHLRRNPEAGAGRNAPLVLDGEDLDLLSLAIDGREVAPERVVRHASGLTIADVPDAFALQTLVGVNPSANTKLEGLYRSDGIYCTQCEAQGFRRITFFPDRPDVMARYRVRLEAERDEAPLLLSNGNPVDAGPVPGTGRHFAVWDDPHPKPSYLFALVAGRLDTAADRFVTRSGREVAIAVHVEPGKAERAGYALEALKRSMEWDERAFGLEYDLDVFNIVAVADFNMGAMENKGLNIFNDRYVLASPLTATDADYDAIEAIVGHEYFHNWSGNRVTCRDWFQLTLKEGLTVFRDQEFTSDLHSRAVKRIGDVRQLRAQQFAEDAGPLSHPCRPKSYREINNFYTATVYEKGAEIVRALKTLLGAEAFAAGLSLYFRRCDGRAATLEDFVAAFREASGRDLGGFFRWWEQAGTPELLVRVLRDADRLTLELAQATAPTPGEPRKAPLVMPVSFGLVGLASEPRRIEAEGATVRGTARSGLIEFAGPSARVTFHGVSPDASGRIVPSVLRGFSAPVRLSIDLDADDLAVLLARDEDPFNRWQAGQTLALRALVPAARGEEPMALEERAARLGALLAPSVATPDKDPAFLALLLQVPGEGEIARELARDVDPDAVLRARRRFLAGLGRALGQPLRAILDAPAAEPEDRGAAAAAARRLRQAALHLVCEAEPEAGAAIAEAQFRTGRTMGQWQGALAALVAAPPGAAPARERCLDAFEARWRDEPLVLDKWFGLQATIAEPGTAERVGALMRHPRFSLSNPNRVRALLGSFGQGNPSRFNAPDGAGHRLLAEAALAIDGANPQLAARLMTAFRAWATLEPARRASARAALERVAGAERLSADLADIVGRSLA